MINFYQINFVIYKQTNNKLIICKFLYNFKNLINLKYNFVKVISKK